MTLYEDALALIVEAAERRGALGAEPVAAAESLGRTCATDLRSRESLPAFDNSSMDGYAVRARATRSASPASPVRLAVTGESAAGDPPRRAPARGCWTINTGAALPRGFDSVVRLEEASVLDDGRTIELRAPSEPGDWVRRRGQDFAPKALVVAAGEAIEPRHLLALSALGISRVPARRRPRLAVLSTGSELVREGGVPRPGEIRNSTLSYLEAFLAESGAETALTARVPDEPRVFERALRDALDRRPDAVITTGAVSVGRHDFVGAALKRLGCRVLYHRVAIRPGKPGLLALLPGGTPVFGLPGNPVSTVVGSRFFVLPYLRRLLGLSPERPLAAELSRPAEKPEGLRCFYKARVRLGPRGLLAEALEGQASFQLRSLLEANAWLVLPESGRRLPARAAVEVFPLSPRGLDLR